MDTDPDLTIPTTNPGWLCQPESPPTSCLISWTTTSVASFVWNLMRSALRCTSWLSVPRVCGPGWKPLFPGVARAVTPEIATVASPTAATKIALCFCIALFSCVCDIDGDTWSIGAKGTPIKGQAQRFTGKSPSLH